VYFIGGNQDFQFLVNGAACPILSCQFGTMFTDPAAPHSVQTRHQPTCDQGGLEAGCLITLAKGGMSLADWRDCLRLWIGATEQPFHDFGTMWLSVTAGDWHVSIQVEQEIAEPALNRGSAVGVDLGVAQPIALSNGTLLTLPRMDDAGRRRLAAAQRRIARRQKGSSKS
jgi:hypothetical protein